MHEASGADRRQRARSDATLRREAAPQGDVNLLQEILLQRRISLFEAVLFFDLFNYFLRKSVVKN